MKVDTEDLSEQWIDSLSIRILLPLQADISNADTGNKDCLNPKRFPIASRRGRFVRSSSASLMALRDLRTEAPLVLFTPFVRPAGWSSTGLGNQPHRDPFEGFGRELAEHHPNICHVPYVPSVGFTETHFGFVQQSEAVVTVVCEPERPSKKDSVREQHDFAEAAIKACASRLANVPSGVEMVLVQCGTNEAYRRASYSSANVLNVDFYDDETAIYLADTILGRV